jgi:hypothetical protein
VVTSQPFAIEKGVRIIGEAALAESRGVQQEVEPLIKGQYDPGGRVGPVMHPKNSKQQRDKGTDAASVGSKNRRKKEEEKPNPPPPVEMLGLEAIEQDSITERHHQRVAEDAFCVQDVRVRSPVAGARNTSTAKQDEEKKKIVMWSYHQQSALEIDHSAGLQITSACPTDILIQGIALFHKRHGMQNFAHEKSGASNGLVVSSNARVWMHDCTVSHLYGKGDAIHVNAQGSGMLCVSDSVICSAPGNGVSVKGGSGVVLLDTEICGNGLAGVTLLEGAVLARRVILFGNQSAVSFPHKGAKVGMIMQSSDLRGNLSADAISLAPGLAMTDCALLENVLLEDDEEVDPDSGDEVNPPESIRELQGAQESQQSLSSTKVSPVHSASSKMKRKSPASRASTPNSRKRPKDSN